MFDVVEMPAVSDNYILVISEGELEALQDLFYLRLLVMRLRSMQRGKHEKHLKNLAGSIHPLW